MKKIIHEKTQNIEYLDKTNHELKNKLSDKTNFEARERHALKDEVNKY